MLNSDSSNYNWPGVLEFLYVPSPSSRPNTRKSPSKKTCGSLKRRNSPTRLNSWRGSWPQRKLSTPISSTRTTCLSIVSGRSNLRISRSLSPFSSPKYPSLSAGPNPTKPRYLSNSTSKQNSLQFRGDQFAVKHKQRPQIKSPQQHTQNRVLLALQRIPQAINESRKI